MEERRFIITEMDDWGQPIGRISNCVVSEPELLHRLSLCVTSKDRIATLLNKKHAPTPTRSLKNDTDGTSDVTRNQYVPPITPYTTGSMPGLPTRPEWEEWAGSMPDLSFNEQMLRWTIAMRKWLTEMPGIPKE